MDLNLSWWWRGCPIFNIRFVSNKRGQLSTCGDDVNKGGLSKVGGKNIDLPTRRKTP